MKIHQLILLIAVALLAGIAGAWFFKSDGRSGSAPRQAAEESTYDRVMRTQTIRCGYAVWEPALKKDPQTGQLSGIFYDYMEELGKVLKLKIEWTQETGWGDFPEALRSNRIDVMAAGVWANGSRAPVVDFSIPLYFNAIYPYVRADDHRFDAKLDLINSPNITVAAIDGEMSSIIAKNRFPQAKVYSLSQLSNPSEILLSVATRKADVTCTDSATALDYMAKNPGSLRQVGSKPLCLFGNTLPMRPGQEAFRRMIDNATRELLDNGTIERMIQKYEKHPGSLYRVALPYQPVTSTSTP